MFVDRAEGILDIQAPDNDVFRVTAMVDIS